MQVRYGDQLKWELRTGGLRSKVDPDFDVKRENPRDPDEMAEAWGEMAAVIEMPMNPDIWRADPPGSANAGCYAIKAAQEQGERAGERMARLVREGTFVHGINFGRTDNILDAARSLGLDFDRFKSDLTSDRVRASFRDDWEAARHPAKGAPDTKTPDGVLRYAYPTFEFYGVGVTEPVVTVDYQDPNDYARYDEALATAAPGIEKQPAPHPRELFELYRTLTTREVAVCCDLDNKGARQALEQLARDGHIKPQAYGDEPWAILWSRSSGSVPD